MTKLDINLMRRPWASLTLAAAVVLSACTSAPQTPSVATSMPAPTAPAATPTSEPAPAAPAGFPVTIENCGNTLTFDRPPARVVSLYPPVTEMLVKLTVKDPIVGIAFADDNKNLLPDLRAAANGLPVLTKKDPPSKEVLLSTTPDLVIDNQPDYFYDGKQGFATREEVNAAGAQIYTLTAKCNGGVVDATIDMVYTDLLNLGMIFGKTVEAEAAVAEMKATLADVQSKLNGVTPKRVMIYDAGEGPLGVFGPGTFDYGLKLAGGTNAFADLKESYAQLSVEEVAAREFDYFVVPEYDDATQKRVDFLLTTFSKSKAARNKRVITLPYQNINPSIQNAIGVSVLAKALHPERFGVTEPAAMSTDKTSYPITVENCGKQITIAKKPERVIVSWGGQAAYLLSLGLSDSIIGMYYRFPDEENRLVPTEVRDAYMKIPVIGGEKAPSREVPLALNPDFFYSDNPGDFATGQASVDDYTAANTTVFSSVFGCTDPNKQTLEMMFAEISALGMIFDQQVRARELVSKIKADLAVVEAKVAGLPKVKAVLVEGSDQTLYAAGNGLVTDAFARAGGINLFDGATYDAPPSREKLAASEPDVVVLWDNSVKDLAPVMETVFANAPAVKNKRVVGVRYIGGIGIRVAELVENLAREFHPEAFK